MSRRMRHGSLTLLFFLTSCADFNPDHYRFSCSTCGGASAAGGSSGGMSFGGAPGGGTVGGGSAGGGSPAGGQGGGGIGSTAGGLGAYTLSELSLEHTGNGDEIVSIAGTATDLYAGSRYGSVYHSTNGTQFTTASALGVNEGKYFYMAPSGRLFVATGKRLGICDSDCLSETGYSWTNPVGLGYSVLFYAVCGSSHTNVFAIGHGFPNFDGIAFHYNGTNWTGPIQLGLSSTVACWVDGTDVVWVAGDERVARLERGAVSLEGADLSALGPGEAARQQWFGIFGGGGAVHVVGSKERIMSRNAAGQWRLSLAPQNQTAYPYRLRAIGGLSSDDLFAVGDQACSSCADSARIYRFDGTRWTLSDPLSFPYEGLISVHAIPPSTILIGGSVRSNLRPGVGIIRALR